MNYLLDTCIISELTKRDPNPKVVKWIREIEETKFYISVFTIGEIHKGIKKLPDGQKKDTLHKWVDDDLKNRFKNKIIEFDLRTATIWGKIQAESERAGHPLPAIDGLIAATGISNELIVVTRNTIDMAISGVTLLNPWESTEPYQNLSQTNNSLQDTEE